MDINQALQLKRKSLLNVDNCIFTDAISKEDIKKLESYVESFGVKVNVIDFSFRDIGADESPQTTALRYLYEAQKIRDKVVGSLDFFIITNYTNLYKNFTTEFLKKSDPQFLCWYLTYQMNLNPLMFLTTKANEKYYALVNIFMKGDIIESFNKRLEEIEEIVNEAMNRKEEN